MSKSSYVSVIDQWRLCRTDVSPAIFLDKPLAGRPAGGGAQYDLDVGRLTAALRTHSPVLLVVSAPSGNPLLLHPGEVIPGLLLSETRVGVSSPLFAGSASLGGWTVTAVCDFPEPAGQASSRGEAPGQAEVQAPSWVECGQISS